VTDTLLSEPDRRILGGDTFDARVCVDDACQTRRENVMKTRKGVGEVLSQSARFQIRVVGANRTIT
jgi:hypothetical protein